MEHLDALRRNARIGAIVLSVASAILTFSFGLYTNTNLALAITCAVGLVVCSVSSDYIWLFVSDAWKAGRQTLATSLVLGAVLFTGVNLITNLGSVGWQRDSANQTAKLNTVSYEDTRKEIEDAEALRKILTTERDRLIKERGWAALVPSNSFDGRIEAQKLALSQEAARGGCKAKCLIEREKLAKLEDDKATALKIEKDEKQLEAIDKKLSSLKAKSDGKRPEVSAAKSQSTFFAGLATVSLDPSDTAEQWTNKALAILIAVFLVFGPQVLSFVGHRRSQVETHVIAEQPKPAWQVKPSAEVSPIVTREQTGYVIVNDDEARRLKEAIKNAIAPRQLRAA